MTSAGLLQPIPAFLFTYLGVVSGLSLGYFLGRLLGTTVLEKIRGKRNMGKYIDKSESLIRRYGEFALFIRYALISYLTGFIWTLLFFIMGRFAGTHVQEAVALIHTYGLRLLGASLCVILMLTAIHFLKKSRNVS